jgi:hypothetical protein
VAHVIGVRRDNSQLPAQVRARPVADVERDREVILLQFSADNPAAPAPSPAIAPLPTPKPKPAPKPSDDEDQ